MELHLLVLGAKGTLGFVGVLLGFGCGRWIFLTWFCFLEGCFALFDGFFETGPHVPKPGQSFFSFFETECLCVPDCSVCHYAWHGRSQIHLNS